MSSEWVYSLADISAGFSIQQTLSQQAQLQSLKPFQFYVQYWDSFDERLNRAGIRFLFQRNSWKNPPGLRSSWRTIIRINSKRRHQASGRFLRNSVTRPEMQTGNACLKKPPMPSKKALHEWESD